MTELALPTLVLEAVEGVARTVVGAAPFLLNRDPAPGELAVPLGTSIALEITTATGAPPDGARTRVFVEDDLAFDGSRAAPVAEAFAGPGSGASLAGDTLRIVLSPRRPLASRAEVRVRVVVGLGAAAAALDQTYTFTAEDRTAPRLVAALAPDQRLVRLVFDERVAVAPNARVTFEPLDLPAVSAQVLGLRAADSSLDVDLARALSPDRRYRVTVAGVTDQAGNAVSSPGDTEILTAFAPARPRARRFDLWSMLPKHNRRLDTTGDLARLVACFQEVTDLLLADIDRLGDVLDLERAPEAVLDRILQDLGNPFTFDLTLAAKRRLASLLVAMYQQKGTAPGIRNILRFFMGIDGAVVQPLRVEGGADGSILGGGGGLAPSARFLRYAFEVVVPVTLSPMERDYLRALVRWAKPAHTHFVRILEPEMPTPHEAWELGRDVLGQAHVTGA